MCAGAAVCAKRTMGEHKQMKANQQRRNLGIDCFTFLFRSLFRSKDRELTSLMNNLVAAERRGKLKIFIDAINSFVLHAVNAS
jgi:hypothetical protein